MVGRTSVSISRKSHIVVTTPGGKTYDLDNDRAAGNIAGTVNMVGEPAAAREYIDKVLIGARMEISVPALYEGDVAEGLRADRTDGGRVIFYLDAIAGADAVWKMMETDWSGIDYQAPADNVIAGAIMFHPRAPWMDGVGAKEITINKSGTVTAPGPSIVKTGKAFLVVRRKTFSTALKVSIGGSTKVEVTLKSGQVGGIFDVPALSSINGNNIGTDKGSWASGEELQLLLLTGGVEYEVA